MANHQRNSRTKCRYDKLASTTYAVPNEPQTLPRRHVPPPAHHFFVPCTPPQDKLLISSNPQDSPTCAEAGTPHERTTVTPPTYLLSKPHPFPPLSSAREKFSFTRLLSRRDGGKTIGRLPHQILNVYLSRSAQQRPGSAGEV